MDSTLPQLVSDLDILVRGTSVARSDVAVPRSSFLDLLRESEEGAKAPSTGARSDSSLARELSVALDQARVLSTAPACPIVAVLGMLNAGKSSLVATFLSSGGVDAPRRSDEYRSRVLIGAANSEGTHRFVLWLPESWKTHDRFWEFIHERLTSIFGCECEALSEDSELASQQYNDMSPRLVKTSRGEMEQRSPIEVPLVAFDPSLDRLGIALMDCPDVQTGLMDRGIDVPVQSTRYDEASTLVANSRFTVLTRAARICSASIVVLPANSMHDQTVSKLLRLLENQMPHVQRIMAVNRVPRKYLVDQIAKEVHTLYGSSGLRRVYMAYHFEGPKDRDKLPSPPLELAIALNPPLPLFFRVDEEGRAQPPERIPDADWLIRLGRQLQANDLLEDSIRSATTRLASMIHAGLAELRQWNERKRHENQLALRAIADACLDFSIDPHSSANQPRIRLQASRQVVEQIAESLERTAPWWAKPGRWVQRIAQAGKDSVTQATTWFRMPGWVSDGSNAVGDWIRGRFKRGENGHVVTANALCDRLAQRDVAGVFKLDDSEAGREGIRAACQRAIDRFQQESRTRLDQDQVDALTRRLWAEMPMGKRFLSGIAPAGILFAPLLAVIMVPLDFGGSAVLVFASMKELLVAGAAGVGLVMANADSMPQIAETESAWQQLSDLVALVLDELGFERSSTSYPLTVSLSGASRELTQSQLEVKKQLGFEVPGAKLTPFVFDESVIKQIQSHLAAMERAQRS
ncbi:MAG: hypothetical protein ACK52S_21150 [Pirellula sp.]